MDGIHPKLKYQDAANASSGREFSQALWDSCGVNIAQ